MASQIELYTMRARKARSPRSGVTSINGDKHQFRNTKIATIEGSFLQLFEKAFFVLKVENYSVDKIIFGI